MTVLVCQYSLANTALAPTFPNTCDDKLSFTIPNNGQTDVVIFDMMSKEVLRTSFRGSTTINISDLPQSAYFYSLRTHT